MPIMNVYNDDTDSINLDYKTKLTFYTNPEDFYYQLYNKYEIFTKVIDLTFRSALEVVYKIYDKWTKIISSNTEKVKELYNFNHDESPINMLRHIIDTSGFNDRQGHIPVDIGSIFDPEDMSTIANKLNDEFGNISFSGYESYNKDILFNFTVKNSTEIAVSPFSRSITFKVKPRLCKCAVSGVGNNTLNPQIGIYDYDIDIDFASFVRFVNNASKFPDGPESIFELQSFIDDNMANLNRYIEPIAKRIVLEIMDCYTNTTSNFDKFNSKASALVYSILNSEDIKNVLGKVKYLMRSGIGTELDENVAVSDIGLYDFTDNRNFISNILNKIETDNYYTHSDPIESLYYCVNDKENIKKIPETLYNYAFSTFFSDTVVWEFPVENTSDIVIISKLRYCREFDKKYDLVEIYNNIGKLSDYNLRDFYQTIIRDIKKESMFTYIECDKCANGEKESFLVSKAHRFVILYGLAFSIVFNKIVDLVTMLQDSRNMISNKDNKLNSELYNIISDTAKNFASYIAEVVFIDKKCTDEGENDYYLRKLISKGYNKLSFMISILNKHNKKIVANLQTYPNQNKLISFIEKLGKYQVKDCFNIEYNNNNFVSSKDIKNKLCNIVDDTFISAI